MLVRRVHLKFVFSVCSDHMIPFSDTVLPRILMSFPLVEFKLICANLSGALSWKFNFIA